MRTYTTFDFYQHKFLGTVIADEVEFSRCLIPACTYLDELTLGRLKRSSVIPEEVEMAACALVEVECRQRRLEEKLRSASSAGIKSASNDGYSVTYDTECTSAETKQAERMEAVSSYLPRSHPLRYRGW